MNTRETRFTILIWTARIARNTLSGLLPPLIPILTVALTYPLWQLGLLVTVFSLGSGLGQAPIGVLADKYDKRYILPTGLAFAGGSYFLFALAPWLSGVLPPVTLGPFALEYLLMAVSMLLCGFGTAVVHPTLYPMITANVRAENKGKVMGIFGSAAKFGDATAPVVVGLLALVLLWEGIVVVIGAFGIAFSVLLFVLLGNYETAPIESDRESDADEGESVWESDPREYVYPFFIIYLFFVLRGFAGRGLRTFIPVFIVSVYGYTWSVFGTDLAAESVANFYFSALLIVAGLAQIAVGYVVDLADPRTVLITCMLATTVGILGLAALQLSPILLLGVLVIIGVGQWGLNPARDMLISSITPASREGRTFGYLWTGAHLTSAIIPTIVGYLGEVLGLRQTFGLLAIGSVLAAAVIALLYSDRVYVETPTGTVSATDD